jgi:hypothetical protein
LKNEDDPSFDSKYQREIRLAEEFPSFCSANIFYKQFQMKGNTGSVFSMTNKKIKNVSHLNCIAKWCLLRNIDNEVGGFA